MIRAFERSGLGLTEVTGTPGHIHGAIWIDLFEPTAEEVASLAALGVEVPTLAEMEEIEISNRLYQEDGIDYMTTVVPGQNAADEQVANPVTFILSADRLVTVRHHSPRPFATFPQRAGKSGIGCDSAEQVFLGLIMEIVGRLADHLEGVGRAMDEVARLIYQTTPRSHAAGALRQALARIGGEGERLGRVRLALLTLGRALNHVEPVVTRRSPDKDLGRLIRAELRDIDALEVHANYLDSRVALASDATLGTIDLSQNTTVKIVSLVSVLFLPPTLIASVYGMNFAAMPELAHPYGYVGALVLMVLSAAITWAVFRWKGWL